MKYGFTRAAAHYPIVAGFGFIALGLLVGIASLFWDFGFDQSMAVANQWPIRLSALILFPVAGLILGTPFIVSGQLILILLDQCRLLAQQCRLLAQIHEQLEDARRTGSREGPADRLTMPR